MKLCECGCGQPAPIAKKTGKGYKKGDFKRFIHSHHRGWKLSEETKQKISKSKMGHTYNIGHEVTQETRDKISKSNKGKKRTIETKQRISKSKKGSKGCVTHGHSVNKTSPTYRTWVGMKNRCTYNYVEEELHEV